MKAGIPILRWEMPAEFSGRPEAHRYSETQAWCEDNIAPALAALDPNLTTCFGEDFGRSEDLTVIWPLQIGQDLMRRTPFIVELRNIPFETRSKCSISSTGSHASPLARWTRAATGSISRKPRRSATAGESCR